MRWALATLALLASTAWATPRMSLTAGAPCSTCHSNPIGGGARHDLGWSSMNHVGALTYDQLGMGGLHEMKTKTVLDGMLSVGGDSRLMLLRLGAPRVDAEGEVVEPDLMLLPMQLQPNFTFKANEDLSVYGHYNVGPDTPKGEICDTVFPGQSCFEVAAQVEGRGARPLVRAGMIQPAIGIRNDDHSSLLNGEASNRRRPLIPPNYAEWGAEATFQPAHWLRIDAGGVATQGLDEILNGVTEAAELWPAAYAARISFSPQFEFGGAPPPKEGGDDFEDDFEDDFDEAPPEPPFVLNTLLGASAFGSGEFFLINGFLGVGSYAGAELRLEGAYAKRGPDHTVLNATASATWALRDWLVLAGRVGRATSKIHDDEFEALQAVAGVELFPIPFVEVRPEYRIVRNDEYLYGQPTVMLHLFF